MSLEVSTTAGSIVGTLVSAYTYSHGLAWLIYVIFGAVILASILPSTHHGSELPRPRSPDLTTRLLGLEGEYYDAALGVRVRYWGIRWWLSSIIMFFAGLVSGLLGIGAGVLKVLALDWAMNLPMKVATTTSNFMIGVTAATGTSLYWYFGYIQPVVAGATTLGVLAGSIIGTRALVRAKNIQVRLVFLAILAFLGMEMLLRGLYLDHLLVMPITTEYLLSTIFAAAAVALIWSRQRIGW
jgi:hypothetical protein